MASYALEERFKYPRYCYRLTDPGAYAYIPSRKFKPNKYGFSSNTPRVTLSTRPLYTQNIYDIETDRRILPNVTSFKSKTPRFSFEKFKEEDLDNILCNCDEERVCECPVGEEKVCQAHVLKRLFKGPPPHSTLGEGLSVPTKSDRGFALLHDGSTRRLLFVAKNESPPFYDTRVTHFPEFYRGWKWSRWTAARTQKCIEERPGPADYYLERMKTQSELCNEKVREGRRQKSKQLRLIEKVQNMNILEGRPGPADYDPQLPKGTDLQLLGPTAARFRDNSKDGPGPADYSVKRYFDPPMPPEQHCRAKLPPPACFGIKANRFRRSIEVSPGPASYDARVKPCKILNCSKAPFGCSALRFKEDKIYDDETDKENELGEHQEEEKNVCLPVTWQFRSKTERFKSSRAKYDPVISNLRTGKLERSVRNQENAPFNTSEGRFQPWFDWLPISSGTTTPGPGYYNLNKLKCLPAVYQGPLFRDRRFRGIKNDGPAPNAYTVGGGIESVLYTPNLRLQENIKKKSDEFKWILPEEPIELSPLERECAILERAIRQLEVEKTAPTEREDEILEEGKNLDSGEGEKTEAPKEGEIKMKKMLRTFLYKHTMPNYS